MSVQRLIRWCTKKIFMKRDHKGCIRAYYRSTKAYYALALPNENLHVMFGMYDPNEGSSGEMKIEWVDIPSTTTTDFR